MALTMKEINQIAIFEKMRLGKLTQKTAAKVIGCSIRTVRRRSKRYFKDGAAGLAHKSRGKPGNRRTEEFKKRKVLDLMQGKYAGWPPTHAAQVLSSRAHIKTTPSTLRRWLLEAGLWKRQRKRRCRRKWRERKACFGQMLQLDGSSHKWIVSSDEYWTLLKFIDDATGRVFARFYSAETHAHVVDLTIRYFKKFGKPISIYTDRGGVYKINNNNEDGERITNYDRALTSVGVELIHAYSPQAKGRVERSFLTDQARLVRELALHEITTMDTANMFLEQIYLPQHNRQFAVPARESADLHQRIGPINLNDVFTLATERTVNNDWTVIYNGQWLQLDNSRPAIVKPRDVVIVNERLDGTLFITIRKEEVSFKPIPKKTAAKHEFDLPRPFTKPYKSPPSHPWRQFIRP